MATQEFLLGNIKGATGATGPAGAGAATDVFAGVIPGSMFSSNQAGSLVFMWRFIGDMVLPLPGGGNDFAPVLLEIAAGGLINRQQDSGLDAPFQYGNQKHILTWHDNDFFAAPSFGAQVPAIGPRCNLAFVPTGGPDRFLIYLTIKGTWGQFMNRGLEPYFTISFPAPLPAGAYLRWDVVGVWEGLSGNTAPALFANARYIALD